MPLVGNHITKSYARNLVKELRWQDWRWFGVIPAYFLFLLGYDIYKGVSRCLSLKRRPY